MDTDQRRIECAKMAIDIAKHNDSIYTWMYLSFVASLITIFIQFPENYLWIVLALAINFVLYFIVIEINDKKLKSEFKHIKDME